MKVGHYYSKFGFLMILVCLFSGCSDDTTTSDAADEIRFNVDVWQVMLGTRTTTFEGADPLASGSFKTYAFIDGSADLYINGSTVTVNYVSGQWEFADGKHYWPASGALNFFAHMPADLTNTYCSFDAEAYADPGNLDGYSEDLPRIMCTNLPVAITVGSDATQELICAYVSEQDKAGTNSSKQPTAGQVALAFKHPFTCLKFQLSASHPDIKINSITFKNVKNSGICAFDGSEFDWTLTGDDKDLIITVNQDFNSNPASPLRQIGETCLVIPQIFAGAIEVNASWIDWGETFAHNVSTTIPSHNWAPGTSYTYTFTITETDLRVDTSKFTEQW